jgi:hypothetical protein
LPPAHPHHAAYHVVGRIKHRIHHKYVHAGPPAAAPNPNGCEKHAVAGPGYGHGALPSTPFPAAPVSKLAALGGGFAAFGGVGGLVGGFGGGGGTSTHAITKTPLTPPGVNPIIPVVTPPVPVVVPPVVTPTPPTTVITTPPPGNPPVTVPEPSSIVVFCMAVAIALAARYIFTRRLQVARAV